MVGCTVFTTGSPEPSNMESNLALPNLYSLRIDLSRSFTFAFKDLAFHDYFFSFVKVSPVL